MIFVGGLLTGSPWFSNQFRTIRTLSIRLMFKKFDEVQCIDASGSHGTLTVGKVYRVDWITSDGEYVSLQGVSGFWLASRFCRNGNFSLTEMDQ